MSGARAPCARRRRRLGWFLVGLLWLLLLSQLRAAWLVLVPHTHSDTAPLGRSEAHNLGLGVLANFHIYPHPLGGGPGEVMKNVGRHDRRPAHARAWPAGCHFAPRRA